MLVNELSVSELGGRLGGRGLRLRIGRFVTHIRSPMEDVAGALRLMYGRFPLADEEVFADFHVRIGPPPGPRRWLRPQVLFSHDSYVPFKPLPAAHAYAMLEWGLNWCISSHCHQYLMIHAGVIERDGCAAILPAPPGSGKSTLTAALVNRGWRLLSDELALVSREDGSLVPIARPINLKNQSIGIIRAFEPAATIGAPTHDTSKGTVAHMRPPDDSVARVHEPAKPGWVIFPKYQAGADVVLSPLQKGEAFIRLADSAFNFSVLGTQGFHVLADLIGASACYEFTYSRLEDAVEVFSSLKHPHA